MTTIGSCPRIVLLFHPGWGFGAGTVLDAIAASGVYRSQWVCCPTLPLDDPLNDYVEAHVRGELLIARDVEALVVDPTDREAHAEVLERLGCPVEEHAGYRVTAETIDADYRGLVPGELARLLGGEITPARLAAASRAGRPRSSGGQVVVALPGPVRPTGVRSSD